MMTGVTFLAGARADFDSAFDWYSARSESAKDSPVNGTSATVFRLMSDS
jgi:hypothetical protein